MTTSTYPVKVNAHLDAKLSRGLWLVKWLLAIPPLRDLGVLVARILCAQRHRVLCDPDHRLLPTGIRRSRCGTYRIIQPTLKSTTRTACRADWC
jgi:hypothetical protein